MGNWFRLFGFARRSQKLILFQRRVSSRFVYNLIYSSTRPTLLTPIVSVAFVDYATSWIHRCRTRYLARVATPIRIYEDLDRGAVTELPLLLPRMTKKEGSRCRRDFSHPYTRGFFAASGDWNEFPGCPSDRADVNGKGNAPQSRTWWRNERSLRNNRKIDAERDSNNSDENARARLMAQRDSAKLNISRRTKSVPLSVLSLSCDVYNDEFFFKINSFPRQKKRSVANIFHLSKK